MFYFLLCVCPTSACFWGTQPDTVTTPKGETTHFNWEPNTQTPGPVRTDWYTSTTEWWDKTTIPSTELTSVIGTRNEYEYEYSSTESDIANVKETNTNNDTTTTDVPVVNLTTSPQEIETTEGAIGK